MAANTKAQVDIVVTGLASLEKLQTTIGKVNDKFGGLKGIIATLGVAALGRSAIQMADDLQDLSNSTGIATARLLEFKKALTVSGGQAEAMPNAINQFIRSIDEAAQGSIKAQDSFIELGVSLNDLRTLSEQELLQKTLRSIAAVEDPARRAALMMEYFGKSMKTVDPRELSDRLVSTAGSADQYSAALRRAADLNDQLATAQGTLKLAVLEAFSPLIGRIVDFNKAIEDGKASIDALVSIFKVLATVVAVAFAFTAVGVAVRIIGTIGRGVGNLIGLFGGVGTTVTGIFRATGPVMSALRGVGGAIAAIAAGIATVLGLSDKTANAGAGRGGQGGPTAEELRKYNDEQNKAAQDAANKRDVETKQRQNAISQVKSITEEFGKQNKFSLDRLKLETDLIGKSDEEKQSRQAQFDLTKQFLDLQDQLKQKRDALSREEQFLVPVYNEQLKASQKLYDAQKIGLDEVLGKQQVANALEKDRQSTIEQINKALERQATFGEQLVTANDKLKKIEFEGKIEGLNGVQKQIAQINEEARLGALEAGRAIAAQYEGLDLSAAQSAELAGRLEEIRQRYEKIAEQQIINLENSRTFASGWKKAFAEYVEDATNAAKYAQSIFQKATQGMEDLIVNFAKTGKFEFKGFMNSILEELLRSQVRQLMGQMFNIGGATGGAGGFFGGIGKLLGFANGGIIPTNNPVLVGERGPELISGAAGRNVTPNSALGGGNYVTYNINAVDAMSFKQLVASDPAFLYAVTQQGAKSVPQNRR
jgi:lambda family phage tail tape measure protein